ncbi:hypothetical protein G6F43_003387 [Rhizopus delemar]|nr:hypothetical protein G6F43_003387 [Rhizopus delemar]
MKGKQKDTLFSPNQKKPSKSENDSFELYVEDNSDDDFQPVVTARKRKSRENIPQSGSQKKLKDKGKATDSEVTTTSITGISTTDEPTVFNKITLEDNDLDYFDAPVIKRPFLGESTKSASRITKSTSTAVKSSSTASKTSINSPKPSKSTPTAFKSASKNCFKAFLRLAELSEAEQTKQFACFPLRTAFIPCYMTLNSKITHSHILKSKKNIKTGSRFETWGAVQFQGTLETDGVGVSIIKQNTDTSRKSPKPNTEKKVDDNQTEHIEGLGQADLKSIEGKCVLIDPGRRDLMYCMKETSTVEEKQILIFTKNNCSKCSRHFGYLRKRTQPFVVQKAEAVLSRCESNSVNLKSLSKETYFPESEFDFRVDQKCNLYYGNLFIARIRGFFPQPKNYSTDSSTIGTALEKLQLLPFRKLKFSIKLFFDQNDQKLIRSLKAKFGQDAVLVFGDRSAPNVKYQEPTRSKGLIRMLKKNGFAVYLINEYKTSSHCPTCENELEKFKTVPSPRRYQRKKKPNELCNGLLRCKSFSCLKQQTTVIKRRLWNRDQAAVLNFFKILNSLRKTGERPSLYIRKYPLD